METVFRTVDEKHIDMKVIAQAAEFLKAGEMVAFPTETVYGLGANALDEHAARKIYEAKGRPSDNPLIAHVCNIEQVRRIVKEIPAPAQQLMEAFWPGPLTIIFHKAEVVPYGTTGGLDTVAVRMPSHKVALKLMEYADMIIAAPSANTSGRPSPTTAAHVKEDLNGKIAMILDGGPVGIGIESTIVDMTSEVPMILRPGYITKRMLEEIVGPVEIDQAILAPHREGEAQLRPKAPGMKYRHYAPKADFKIVEGNSEAVIKEINRLAEECTAKGAKVGVIASDETVEKYQRGESVLVVSMGSRMDELSISRNLYRILRDFDTENVDFIFGESFDSRELGQAIMNRLIKAAGYQILHV